MDLPDKAMQKLIESFPALLFVAGMAAFLPGPAGGVTFNVWFPITGTTDTGGC